MIRIAGYFFSCMCPKCGKQDEEGPERASGFSYSLTGIPRIFLLPHTFVEHGHRTTSQVTARSSSVCYQVWRSRICFFSVFIGDLSCPFPRFGLPDRFHHFTGGYCGRALMGKGPLTKAWAGNRQSPGVFSKNRLVLVYLRKYCTAYVSTGK